MGIQYSHQEQEMPPIQIFLYSGSLPKESNQQMHVVDDRLCPEHHWTYHQSKELLPDIPQLQQNQLEMGVGDLSSKITSFVL
jgi:hypothetical protein